jgi:diguanylate cyclase (GGDEF)-like protein/PAS domain S-box-containing protein
MPYRGSAIERLKAVISAQRDVMACGLDPQRVMDVTTESAQKLTCAAAAVVELREGDFMVYRSVSGAATASLGVKLDLHTSLSGRAVLEDRILACVDADTDPRVNREMCRKVGARSMLCVPLAHGGTAVGVLKVFSPEPSWFDDEDIGTLELMVGFIAAATTHAVAQRALYSSEQRFRGLAELATDGIVSVDAKARITFWNASAARMFGYSESEIMGRPFGVLLPERYAMAQAMADGSFSTQMLDRVLGNAFELTCVRRNGAEFPVEVAASTWSVGDERFYTSIVRDISERKQLEAAVLTLARTDHLTGLLNRRAGEESLERELVRARRFQRDVSLVLLDVDHFKRINDSAGHAGGDHVLRKLAGILSTRIRGSDVPIRWGGEEFLLVLPETALSGASELAESLRRMVEESDFEAVPKVTVSLGVVTIDERETPQQAIARCDARLYEAKSGGRNRVVR